MSVLRGVVSEGFEDAMRKIDDGTFKVSADSEVLLYRSIQWTIAHLAAEKGLLPEGFKRWDLCGVTGVSVAESALIAGTLPDDFDAWDQIVMSWHTPLEITLAHWAVRRGLLPKSFNRWEIQTQPDSPADKETVAHWAAKKGILHEGFRQWGLVDGRGNTVAHIAARWGVLPEGFSEWDLKDAEGRTVAEVSFEHPEFGAQNRARFDAFKIASEVLAEDGDRRLAKAFIRTAET
ncbi:protein of unknown function [Thauera humireducens]|uniref:hypothetical protein n=1 Tax=Thauera humireducens TaxID=1134435 RepID=UPI002467A410|nr:hypothetical protein [Thauera humireducens]CAH1748163.1 protein of unknown function [Thauera humireducens]